MISIGKNQHVTPKGDKWQLATPKQQNYLTSKLKQKSSVKTKQEKNHSELLVHGKDGRIRSKDSFGNDPYPPKDLEH